MSKKQIFDLVDLSDEITYNGNYKLIERFNFLFKDIEGKSFVRQMKFVNKKISFKYVYKEILVEKQFEILKITNAFFKDTFLDRQTFAYQLLGKELNQKKSLIIYEFVKTALLEPVKIYQLEEKYKPILGEKIIDNIIDILCKEYRLGTYILRDLINSQYFMYENDLEQKLKRIKDILINYCVKKDYLNEKTSRMLYLYARDIKDLKNELIEIGNKKIIKQFLDAM